MCCKVAALVKTLPTWQQETKYVTLKKGHELGSATSAELEFSLRHTPLVSENEEKEHLQQMLDKDIIVPSTSEW